MLITALDRKFTARKLEISPTSCDFAVRINPVTSVRPSEHNPYLFDNKYEHRLLDIAIYALVKHAPDVTFTKKLIVCEPPLDTKIHSFLYDPDSAYIEYPLLNIWGASDTSQTLDRGTVLYLATRPQSCARNLWAINFPKSIYDPKESKYAFADTLTFRPLQKGLLALKEAYKAKCTAEVELPIVQFENAMTFKFLQAMALEIAYLLKGVPADLSASLLRQIFKVGLPTVIATTATLPEDPAERFKAIRTLDPKIYDSFSESVDFGNTIRAACRWSLNLARIRQVTILHHYISETFPKETFASVSGVNPFEDLLKSLLDSEEAAEGESGAESPEGKPGFATREDKELSGIPVSRGGEGTRFIDDGKSRRYGDYSIKVNPAPKSGTGAKSYAAQVSAYGALLARFGRKLREIRTYNIGGKMPGLETGKLDRKNLYKYRTTSKIFYNNTYKQREHDLAVGVLLDESGSMCGEGIENGRAALVLMHEVLTNLNINHCIAGHTSSGRMHDVIINPYVWFRENKNYVPKKCTALATISAKSGNCDSGALYFMEQEFMKTHNSDKLCLIFSDGAPTECTEEELKAQVEHMEKRGIKVIGIGVDFPNIAKYYKDHANGTSLLSMLDITCDILQRYILQKDS